MSGGLGSNAQLRRPPMPAFRLRSLRLRDASTLARLCGDPGVALMTGRMPHPYRFEDAERFLAMVLGVEPTERVWGVELDFENGPVLAGAMGWAPIRHDGRVEHGYWLGRPFWGRGLATAASAEVLRRAFSDPSLREVVAGTFKDNSASMRVLEKQGFKRVGEEMRHALARGGAAPAWRWRLTREDWEASRRRDGERKR